ncbi:DUF2637 domain-containing protein [Micromonospora zamorensis]|uniref:DUF2637 domain-containing protein n=1 Tax=Micromonospora zamorensis TaxID=709883 RepID=UPI0033AF24CC
MTETQLRRMQWAVRATLALGVAASVTANILHAQANPISQAIAAWPPLALLITVELVTRVPVHRRALGVIRVFAASAIAAIAAWISYHHMVGAVARYGETGTVPYLLPVSVDGLIIVASVSLVELAARLRELEDQSPSAPVPVEVTADIHDTAPTASSPLPERPPGGATTPSPDEVHDAAEHPTGDHQPDDNIGNHGSDDEPHEDDDPDGGDGELAPDLVPLLPAAREARDELTREGQAVSRDALARRLRRNGHSIRNSGVSELLTELRRETRSVNGSRPTASA